MKYVCRCVIVFKLVIKGVKLLKLVPDLGPGQIPRVSCPILIETLAYCVKIVRVVYLVRRFPDPTRLNLLLGHSGWKKTA
uniref:Putative secreted protein n=1 Tax=Anopheles darlingi TaxID=43151 RepID=A0A2M4D6Q8_ANODA